MIQIELKEVAPSVNHIWNHKVINHTMRTYLTKEGREFKDRLADMVPKDHKPYEGSVWMDLILTFPNRLRRDIDNYCKAILDALQPKVYKDDSQIMQLNIKKQFCKNQPSIKITLGEL